ncbi:MAG: histone deacetylase family protein, partial [Rhodobacteraceae bacterium]|nr:histone deacetylase family protein [Paracoccaceae bacterium]
MTTAVYLSEAGRGHLTPPGHPEQVARLTAVAAALSSLDITPRPCPTGDEADVLRCHPPRYLGRVKHGVPATGWAQL